MITLVLPYPPSINHYWRRVGNQTLLSRDGRAFRDRVIETVFLAGRKPPIEGEIAVSLFAYPPDQRRRDIDNLIKSTLDALEHAGVYRDDFQVADLSITRRHCVSGGKIVVNIKTYIPEVTQ